MIFGVRKLLRCFLDIVISVQNVEKKNLKNQKIGNVQRIKKEEKFFVKKTS